jgi:hypothetical protein
MTATHFNVRKRDVVAERRPLSLALLIAMLTIMVATCIALIAPIVWSAIADGTHQAERTTVFHCAIIDADAERLACYDRLGRQTLQPPAKGAFAPFGLAAPSR